MGTRKDVIAGQLYERILQMANYFLTAANKFSINTLQDFDPSFEELARIMDDLGNIVYILIDESDPHLSMKAGDYCYLMRKMAVAIRSSDNISLNEAVSELEKKPFC